eukprot:COSAG02_NODE_68313_length_251_cov_0.506579_1_plen_50_part_01
MVVLGVAVVGACVSGGVGEVGSWLEWAVADVSATSAALESTVASLRTEQS